MHYTGQVYRPPAEAWTPLLEVSYGCSHNKCAFCTMYTHTPFGMAKLEDIEEDIIELKNTSIYPIERIYLTGGDPLVMKADRLIEIGNLIHKYIPEIKTITCYASFYNLKNKSVEDLKKLKELGYNQLYIGVETGYEPALDMINKGISLDEAYEQLKKLKAAEIDYISILMLGIAGKGKARENAQATAKLLNTYPPISLGIMTTDVQVGSKLYEYREEGIFVEATIREALEEQIILLENLDFPHPEKVTYSSFHVVNPVQIMTTLDKKDQIIDEYKKALRDLPDEVLDRPNKLHAI
ncbi:MAG: radical SAM protein [Finegoldia sp.]|nr:radical SAM protein [Finegoldia sp.]